METLQKLMDSVNLAFSDLGALGDAIKAIITAFIRLGELFEPF